MRRGLRAPRRWRRFPGRWALGATLAVVAGVAAASLVERADAVRSAYGEHRTVPVVTRSLAAGAVIGPGDVAMLDRPLVAVPDGVAVDPVGRVVRSPLVVGEVLAEVRLGGSGEGPAALLDPDARALAVPRSPDGLALAVGDLVEVLAPDDRGAGGARRVARAADVLAVDEGSVTLGVSAAEAPGVARAVLDGAVALALVGPSP
ncbi:MAG: SAF domain-containing protein [Acidimicrobiales bacterium]|nr:SAF domain-containing protein [Acidimicrobiales bacterium]